MFTPPGTIEEHELTVNLPIRLLVLRRKGIFKFKILIYYEQYLKGDESQRDVSSDVPIASWTPDEGIIGGTGLKYLLVRDAGLFPILDTHCKKVYKAWRRARKERKERKRQGLDPKPKRKK